MRTETHLKDGREIITRVPAIGKPLNPHVTTESSAFSKITRLLIADGTEAHECDICGWTHENMGSVIAHLGSHVEKNPMYDVKTIKMVIREVLIEIRDGGEHGAFVRAADALNKRGITPYRSDAWNGGTIRNLFTRYADKYPVKIYVKRATVAADIAPPQTEEMNGLMGTVQDMTEMADNKRDVLVNLVTNMVDDAAELMEYAKKVNKTARELARQIVTMTESPQIDQSIIDDAQRWADFQKLMNGKN